MKGVYTHMRSSSFNHSAEEFHVPWYFKAVTIVLSWIALGGYVLFAIVFTSSNSNSRVSRSILSALAGILLALGYTGAMALAIISKNLHFVFDAVLIPFSTTCAAGLMITGVNAALHRDLTVSNAFVYGPLILAIITTSAIGPTIFFVSRRLDRVEKVPATELPSRPASRWETKSFPKPFPTYGDPETSTELMAMEIPADEAQRKQLLRLLLAHENHRSSSPDNSSTYRISLPGEDGLQTSRTRTDSIPSVTNKWSASNLLGRNKPVEELVRAHSRETRRREIERDSLSTVPSIDQSAWPPTAERPAWAVGTY